MARCRLADEELIAQPVGRVGSTGFPTSSDVTQSARLTAMNNDNLLPSIFTSDDLTAALWRAHALRRLQVTGVVPHEAHHCDDADHATLVLLMCTGNPEEIAAEAQWATTWYRVLLAMFSERWDSNPWAIHRRLTGGAYLDIHPSLDTPYGEDDGDDDF